MSETNLEIEELKGQIKAACQPDSFISDHASKSNLNVPGLDLKLRRTLRGHIAKVYELDFCQNDPDLIVSASQDGKLIVWNGLTTHKLFVIPLDSQWVLTCAFAPGGRHVACGGLDNALYIYQLNEDESIPGGCVNSFKGHEGSLSRTRFLDDDRVITTSGDRTQIMWNLNSQQNLEQQFFGHSGDVMCLDIGQDRATYVTGSLDKTAMLWDIRTAEPQLSFTGHTSDINAIKYFPNNNAFATGSDDGSVRLYDIRGDRELMSFHQPDNDALRVLSLCFSNSGKYLFTACHTYIFAWNTLTGEKMFEIEDSDIIPFVGINPSGNALYTASWNNFIKVYA